MSPKDAVGLVNVPPPQDPQWRKILLAVLVLACSSITLCKEAWHVCHDAVELFLAVSAGGIIVTFWGTLLSAGLMAAAVVAMIDHTPSVWRKIKLVGLQISCAALATRDRLVEHATTLSAAIKAVLQAVHQKIGSGRRKRQ